MRVHFELPHPALGPVVLTIGSFDGVHPGHQAVIQRTVSLARAEGWTPAVLTFEPHPRCVVDPDHCPRSLTTLEEKLRLFERLGVGDVLVLQFTTALSRMPPDEFMAHLKASLVLKCLVVGPDFALGHRRQGNIDWLRSHGAEEGYRIDVLAPVAGEAGELHSSEIRRLVTIGDLPAANQLLGRPYSIAGLVQPGDRVGRQLGFPTANISVAPNKLVPALGAYAGRVLTEMGEYPGALSVGYRPTLEGRDLRVEAFLLDFDGDLYQRPIELLFYRHLHDDLKFDTLPELAEQIARDVAETRRLSEP